MRCQRGRSRKEGERRIEPYRDVGAGQGGGWREKEEEERSGGWTQKKGGGLGGCFLRKSS